MTTLTVAAPASKKDKIIYWIFTTIFFLFDGLLPALTFNNQMAKDGIHGLGFPDYFRIELTVGKIIGGLLLILPMVPARFKEWAYVGFGISIISAFVGNIVVMNNANGGGYMAIGAFVVLLISYVYYHKIYRPFKSE
ncbi:DoxX family protein [Mucilaginibacter ginkgonis]|uniref:DoxX family protein n=1 Tax=Mucilaginibacter ginkgonis TaxID=2682091 RepID=A0A6I4I5C2_9SPHI|nr:DoxX family protein [Mucilaginibacter ginkgonis]QQL49177.1 DoxX family protein [Mucilaginibacter ginkgonis]